MAWFTPDKQMPTTEAFRKIEDMLSGTSLKSADTLITLVGLAIDIKSSSPQPGDIKEPAQVVVSLAAITDRLGCDYSDVLGVLEFANAEAQEEFGFTLGSLDWEDSPDDDTRHIASEVPVRFVLSVTLAAIVSGRALRQIEAFDPRAMVVDNSSAAMLALIAKLAEAGGGLLLREVETAGEQIADLTAVAATIANIPTLPGRVFMHDGSGTGHIYVPLAAAIIAAVLHDASVVITTEDVLAPPRNAEGKENEKFEDTSIVSPTWRSFTPTGERLATLLPHVPCAVLVPIASNTLLSPRAASSFVTAVGPLRRDHAIAQADLRALSNNRLNGTVAERLADVWNGRVDHARTSIEAVDRMVHGKPSIRPGHDTIKRTKSRQSPSLAFSLLTEAMLSGITPHVWAPIKLQQKPSPIVFHRELFVCDPDPASLFSERLRQVPGVRIMLLGPPGTGKSGAAAHLALSVLGMAAYDIRMSEVLHYRLGDMEKAIASMFKNAREQNSVLIIDEADSIAQDRATASPGALHLVTAMTNSLLLELDRHSQPIILCCNFSDRIDPAIRRRFDLAFEVKPIPSYLEIRALKLLLKLDPPANFQGFGGDTAVSDYVGAKRMRRLLGGDDEAAIMAVRRARDIRLGRTTQGARRIGF